MRTRKLAVSLVFAFLAVGLGAGLSLASSGERRCLVTLEGGSSVTVSVWSECSVGAVQGLVSRPVLSVADVTPADPAPSGPASGQDAPPTPSRDDRSDAPPPVTTPTTPSTTTPRLPVERTDTLVPRDELDEDEDEDENGIDGEDVERDGKKGNTEPEVDAEADLPLAPPPGFSVPGPIQVGIPNASIDSFGIPPFLLSIYQAAGSEYDVPWSVLAAINEVETGYGRNLNVSSAGAMGWMQFIPSSWARYGVDANGDGRRDPYNPVDAIFAAARYLKAAGAEEDLARAVYAYNHADWYVDLVLSRARQIDELPPDLVGALTGLAQGRMPVRGPVSYAGGTSTTRRALDLRTQEGAAAVAVNDGVITRIARGPGGAQVVELRDVHGNLYTYANLARVATSYPAPKPRAVSEAAVRAELDLPAAGPRPTAPASAGGPVRRRAAPAGAPLTVPRLGSVRQLAPRAPARAVALSDKPVAGYASLGDYSRQVLDLREGDVVLRPLRPGAHVIGGTVLGRVGGRGAGRLSFAVRPSGEGSPAIDPKPVLDGWRKLQSVGGHALAVSAASGRGAPAAGGGQVLLLGKEALERRVLADPRIEIYDCGRRDIQAGQVDRRVLAAIEFLAASGLRPTITSLRCGHSFYTKSGDVSAHSSGNAVDIAAINGVPILGNQGPGSVTEQAIRRLLSLQGGMRPRQIISLMKFEQADNTLVMSDHADHIHVGFDAPAAAGGPGGGSVGVLGPSQWLRVTARMDEIYNPTSTPTSPAAADSAPQVPAGLPRLRQPAEDQAEELERMLEEPPERRRDRQQREDPERTPEPSIEVRPYLIAIGEDLRIEGRGFVCPDGSRASSVTITLGQGGPTLATVRPDRDGRWEEQVRLSRELLPDGTSFPAAFEIHARGECPQGEPLTTKRSPTIVVVRRDDGGGGGGGGGDDNGGGDGGGGSGDSADKAPAEVAEVDDEDVNEDDATTGDDTGAPFPSDPSGGGDDGAEGDDPDVLGASQSSGDGDGDDGDDSNGKNKRKRDRGDGSGGDEGEGGEGDDEGAGGGGKDRKLKLPERAPALVSDPPDAVPSDTAAIPDIDGFGLGDALFVALCALGLALVGALAYAGRWLGAPHAVSPEATTQIMRPGERRIAGPRGPS